MTLIGGLRDAVASATAEKDTGTGTCTRYVAKERRREVVAIADTGLKCQGEDTSYLDALREVIATGRSPGDGWPTGGGVADVIGACEYCA